MTEATPAPVSPREVGALILAAGGGVRVGDRPKAFLEFGGRTLLERVTTQLSAFASELIAALPHEHLEAARRILVGTPARIVAGGATRQETIAIVCRSATRPLVLLHDVARPFVSNELVAAVVALAAAEGAAVAYLPASQRDAVALRDGDHFKGLLPREDVILTQTPQVYRREIILDALCQAERNGWQEVHPAAQVARAGYRVGLVPGQTDNLKITLPEDLEIARRVLGAHGRS